MLVFTKKLLSVIVSLWDSCLNSFISASSIIMWRDNSHWNSNFPSVKVVLVMLVPSIQPCMTMVSLSSCSRCGCVKLQPATHITMMMMTVVSAPTLSWHDVADTRPSALCYTRVTCTIQWNISFAYVCKKIGNRVDHGMRIYFLEFRDDDCKCCEKYI